MLLGHDLLREGVNATGAGRDGSGDRAGIATPAAQELERHGTLPEGDEDWPVS